jgi:hypothetical protein
MAVEKLKTSGIDESYVEHHRPATILVRVASFRINQSFGDQSLRLETPGRLGKLIHTEEVMSHELLCGIL